MSKLREIKRRIQSVGNISQVTNAMQLVAASRMKKAQEVATKGKKYAERNHAMIGRLASEPLTKQHPLLSTPDDAPDRVLLIVFSPQRGLAGSLPGNLLRFTLAQVNALQAAGNEVAVVTVGRKIGQVLGRRKLDLVADFSEMPEYPTTADIRPILRLVTDQYSSNQIASVQLIYPEFINAVSQKPRLVHLLPVGLADNSTQPDETVQYSAGFLYEPSVEAILDEVIPSYLQALIYQSRLETIASEYSARMVAMKNATENANGLRDELTLDFNKLRQTQITNEIAEINAGSGK